MRTTCVATMLEGGHAVVADFGIARAVSAETQHTATGGVLIGTVSYLAPELVVEGRADPRADVIAWAHNETSTGVTNPIPELAAAIRAAEPR